MKKFASLIKLKVKTHIQLMYVHTYIYAYLEAAPVSRDLIVNVLPAQNMSGERRHRSEPVSNAKFDI